MKPVDQVFPYGPALCSGVMKSSAEDFVVVEELGFEPCGDGEHLFLLVENSQLSTPELVARVARDYSIAPAQIGYSGLKDKHAQTRQWLSLHMPGKKLAAAPAAAEAYQVQRQIWHRSKLRRGTHKVNFFHLRLRQVEDLPTQSLAQLDAIKNCGMANYFGQQRFGRRQDNVEQALQQLAKKRIKRMRRSILLSSLRSYLFNQILSQRIAAGYWEQPLDGDVFMLSGSHSIFSEAVDEVLLRRYRDLDISSSASLYGSGRSLLSGEPQQIEAQVFAAHDDITACLDRQRVKLQMRALRVAVTDFEYHYDAGRQLLELQLRLPAGSYMTSLLDHFIAVVDAS